MTVPSLDPEILAYYDRAEEKARLEARFRLEAARTRELIERFLPLADRRIGRAMVEAEKACVRAGACSA